jgi:hypothetical protein
VRVPHENGCGDPEEEKVVTQSPAGEHETLGAMPVGEPELLMLSVPSSATDPAAKHPQAGNPCAR